MTYHPTTDLVAVGWLKGLSGLSGGVATELPKDVTGWPTLGSPNIPFFVQISVVGGSSDNYLNVQWPVVSVDCYAVSPTSSKPPWGTANQVAEICRAGAQDQASIPRPVSMPSGFNACYVADVWLPGAPPRRIVSDSGDYAHYVFEMQMSWSEIV